MNKYYTIEDEDGNSWDEETKNDAMKLANKLEEEGHVCVHVFECIDDENGELKSNKQIY